MDFKIKKVAIIIIIINNTIIITIFVHPYESV